MQTVCHNPSPTQASLTKLAEITAKHNSKNALITAKLEHLFATRILSQDMCVSGFNASKNMTQVEKLIIALLQCVYQQFPQYDCANDQVMPLPVEWSYLIDKLVKSSECDVHAELTDAIITKLVAAVDAEFQYDGPKLAFTLHYVNGVYETPNASAITPKYNLLQYFDDVYVRLPSSYYYAPKEQDAKLLQLLCLQGDMIKVCCNEFIRHFLGQSLKVAPINKLQEHMQTMTTVLNSITSFADLYNIFAQIESNNKSFSIALCALLRLRNCDNETWLENFKNHYLNSLKTLILREFTKRKNTLERMEEDNQLVKLEKQIQVKKAELEKILQTIVDNQSLIEKKQHDLDNHLKKAKLVQAAYENQVKTIESKIASLKKSHEEQEKFLVNTSIAKSTSTQAVKQLNAEKEDLAVKLKSLNAEKSKLDEKLKNVEDHIQQLGSKKASVDLEKKKLENESARLTLDKSRYDQELKSITYLNAFVAKLEAAFKVSDNFYLQRKAIKTKLAALLADKTSPLQALYNYLTQDLKLVDLIDKDFDQHLKEASSYGTYCFQVIWEIIADAKLSYDESQTTMTIKGYNLDWDDCAQQLREFITNSLSIFGFSLENDRLTLKFGAPKIASLPTPLAKLITERIKVKCSPIKYRDPDDDPQWDECTQGLQGHCIKSLDISYLDIFAAYFSNISLISGNDTYIHCDQVDLPGVSLSIWAERNINFKPHCKIITTGPAAMEFAEAKARNGSGYRNSSGRGTGKPGDHGLCGLAGKSAGHISLKAKEKIINLLTLQCEAQGGNGAKGQAAGDGDQGVPGKDTPDAVPDTPGKRSWYNLGECEGTSFATAHTPGIRGNRIIHDEISGDGGDAGKAGLGGEGGHRGDVIIEDQQHTLRLIANAEPIISPDLSEFAKSKICIKSGQAGADGPHGNESGAACGGDAGEAGYHGFPVVITKRIQRKLLVIKKRVYDTSRRDLDIPAAIQTMRSRGAGEYGETANFLHQWTCAGIATFSDAPDPRLRQSKHAISRGKDRRHERNGKLTESKRQQAKKITNQNCNLQHKQQLQVEAQKLSKLTIVAEAKQFTQGKQDALGEKLTKLNDSLNICATKMTQNQQLMQTVTTELNAELVEKESLQGLITKINQDIEQADTAAKGVLLELLEHIEQLSQHNQALTQAKITLNSTKIDQDAETAVLAMLTSHYQMVSSLLQQQQNKALSEIHQAQVFANELKNIEGHINNEIAQLQAEHENLVKSVAASAEKKQALNLAIDQLSLHSHHQESKLAHKIETIVQVAAPAMKKVTDNISAFFHQPTTTEFSFNDVLDFIEELEHTLGEPHA